MEVRSGTESLYASSITFLTKGTLCSNSSPGLSKINSSCTCNNIEVFNFASFNAFATSSIAFFIISAAEP